MLLTKMGTKKWELNFPGNLFFVGETVECKCSGATNSEKTSFGEVPWEFGWGSLMAVLVQGVGVEEVEGEFLRKGHLTQFNLL